MKNCYIRYSNNPVSNRAPRGRKLALQIVCFFLIYSIFPMSSIADTSTKATDYELQEHCGITSSRWAKEHNEVIKYESYYNTKKNKCIIYATIAPIKADNLISSYYMVYDPNANKIMAQYTVRVGPNYEDRICIVNGKRIDDVSEVKWNTLVKDLMEE
jgi:hypothetical protein